MRTYQHTRRIYPQPARVSIFSILPRVLVICALFLVIFYAGWAFRELRQHVERKVSTSTTAPAVRVVVKPVKPVKTESPTRAAGGASNGATLEQNANSIRISSTDSSASAGAGRELLPNAVSNHVGRSSGAQLTRPSPGGTLFSWGLKEWRLARMAGDTSLPEPAQRHMTVISIAASRHSAVVAADGVVWTMGHNDSRGGGGHGSPPLDASGQLGRGGTREPGPVEGPLRGKFVVQVVTGRYHTMAVTADGELYSWGLNDWGQLGRQAVGAASESDPSPCTAGASCHSGIPVLVSMPGGVRVVGAVAGRYVSMAVDESGRLYTWGHDGCSNGGKLPERNEAYKPRLVSGELASKRVVAFDAGYVFWLAATAEGEVYTCNSQDDGYAGTLSNRRAHNNAGELGREGNPLVPGRVTGVLSGKKVEVVAAGREHAVVSTSTGEVYTWGGRELLIGRGGDTRVPEQVMGELQGTNIRYVSAGEYHSGAASETTLYGWGSNNYACIGMGKDSHFQATRPVKALGPISAGGWQVQALAAGYQHALAIAANKGGSWETTKPVPAAAKPQSSGSASSTADAGSQQEQQQQQQPKTLDQKQQPRRQADAVTDAVGQTAATAVQSDVMAFDGEPYTDTSAPDYNIRYLAPQLHQRRYNASVYYHRFRRTDRFKLVQAEAPDVFEMLPPGYLIQYKNPCWLDVVKGFRCLPYYHILGVSKCGTTDLYHRLSKHPELFKARNKGPHWWDECPYPPKGACTAPPNGNFDGYIDLFADAAVKIRQNPAGITGEASSNTFTSSAGVFLRGPSMDRNTTVTIAELMREAMPFLNSIIIFRNPVDRYYSAYYYYRRGVKNIPPPGPEDFHLVAEQDIIAWKACAETYGVKQCVRKFDPQQLIKGMYAVFLMDWLNQFPRDQLLFLRNEDYSAKPREHMEAVFKFLEMRKPTAAEWELIMGMETRNKQSDKYKPMLPETRIMLEQFYQPFNERLAHTLEDDRWLWRDPPTQKSSSSAT
ncbi:hypothetical protein Vretimale_16845 [Volvox reticuliferus]|uniref:Sulfotransferase domain-containing protein n=1 Tax=Volvox reticuliferus TaxID=1737510 RepID=A0A8J4GUH2_9CHLO|nr:hypothetical protein Vretifemale_18503 [Volvox reticuliferus]GIM13783.1 hypothetical protein Vretimale_16845 [Volvox reticuliferus]